MEDINRAQLVETIRAARVILDTAWPQSEDLLNTEQRMGESMVRAQIGVVVTGYLLQGIQEPIQSVPGLDPLLAGFTEITEALREQAKSDEDLREIMRRQVELFNGAVDALAALHRIILERLPLAPEPVEIPQETPL